MTARWCLFGIGLALSGCGGGASDLSRLDTSGIDVPAKFETADDGAKAMQAMTGLWTTQVTTGGKAEPFLGYECDEGSFTFTEDASTPDPNDGSQIFLQCIDRIVSGGSEVQRTIIDGALRRTCLESHDDNTCWRLVEELGEAGAPFSQQTISSSTDRRSQSIKTVESFATETESGVSSTLVANGATQFDSRRNGRSGTVVFDELSTTFGPSGGAHTYHGSFGVSRRAQATANCISGRVTVTTVDGVYHFMGANGTYADVTPGTGNGAGYSVSVNGGAPTIYGFFEATHFCAVD